MNELNIDQKKIILSKPEDNLLILAGAGSGKTFTIVERICYHLELGITEPESILVLTFTRKAANEIKNKIKNRTGKNIDTYTFHSFMYKLLMLHPEYRELNILDDKEKINILNMIKKEYPSMEFYKKWLTDISYFKNTLESFDTYPMNFKFLYTKYNEKLESMGLIDLDDIQHYAIKSLNHDYVLNHIAKYDYLYVDEYQDTNIIQLNFLTKFKKTTNCKLILIGDPKQSIYRWRGASKESFNIIKSKFVFRELYLRYNYRSDANIINISNILRNDNLKLIATKESKTKIKYLFTQNDYFENMFILNEIEMLIEKGYNYKDIAILSRKRSLLDNLDSFMFLNGFYNYEFIGKNSIYETQEIKFIFNIFKLMHNPNDLMAFNYIKSILGIKGIGTKTLLKYEGKSFYDLNLKNDAYIKLCNFIKNNYNKSIFNIIDKIKNLYFKDETYFGGIEKRLENINFIQSEYGNKNIYSIQSVILNSFSEEMDNTNKIKLMTIHVSKGLEFPIVFLIGIEDGNLPSNLGDEEEENNLLYVAITRAKDKLYLCRSYDRKIYGKVRHSFPESTVINKLQMYLYNNQYIEQIKTR